MRKPEKPLPTDCCGTGCPRCVYEIYDKQLADYEKWKATQQENTEDSD